MIGETRYGYENDPDETDRGRRFTSMKETRPNDALLPGIRAPFHNSTSLSAFNERFQMLKIFGKSKRQGHRSKGKSEVLFVEILDDKSVVTCTSRPRGI